MDTRTFPLQESHTLSHPLDPSGAALCDTLVSRFQRPVPVVPWSGVEGGREVECAQEETGVERLLPWGPEVRGEEDCLVINVYTPSLDGARPVMVFIHGGGYYAGGGAHL